MATVIKTRIKIHEGRRWRS